MHLLEVGKSTKSILESNILVSELIHDVSKWTKQNTSVPLSVINNHLKDHDTFSKPPSSSKQLKASKILNVPSWVLPMPQSGSHRNIVFTVL